MLLQSLILLCAQQGPAAQEQQFTPFDYFPADTGILIDFGLSPWAQLGGQTAINELLDVQSLIDSAMPSLQALWMEEAAGFEDVDLAQAFSEMHFYGGITRSLLQDDQVLIAIDFPGEDSQRLLEMMVAEMPEPPVRVGNTAFKVMPLEDHVWPPHREAAYIQGLIEERSQVQRPGDAATFMTQLPSWQRLSKRLASDSRFMGVWIPIETWQGGLFDEFMDMTFAVEMEAEDMEFVTKLLKEIFELDQIGGAAYVGDINGSLIRDRFVLLDGGLQADLYLPFGSEEDANWNRLEECDGNAVVARVGGLDFQAIYALGMQLFEIGIAEQGMDAEVQAMFDEWLPPLEAILAQLQPGVVQQGSSLTNWAVPFPQHTLSFADPSAVLQAWSEFPPEMLAGLQMMFMMLGKSMEHEWDKNKLKLLMDPGLTGESRLGDQEHFKATLPRMKAVAEGQEVLWVTYQAPQLNNQAVEAFNSGWPAIAQEIGMPEAMDFRLGAVAPSASAVQPGFLLITREDGSLIVEGESVLGLFVQAMAEQLAAATSVLASMPDNEFDEDEF